VGSSARPVKPFGRGRTVVAADAGPMEIEFREGAVWRWADAELERATTDSMLPSAG